MFPVGSSLQLPVPTLYSQLPFLISLRIFIWILVFCPLILLYGQIWGVYRFLLGWLLFCQVSLFFPGSYSCLDGDKHLAERLCPGPHLGFSWRVLENGQGQGWRTWMLVWAWPVPDLRCPLLAPWSASFLRAAILCHRPLAYEVECLGATPRPVLLVTDFSPWPGSVTTVVLGEGLVFLPFGCSSSRDRAGNDHPGQDGVETWATGKFPCSPAHHGAGASPTSQSCKSLHGTLHLSLPENFSVSASCSGASPKHGEPATCVSSLLVSFLSLKVLCSEGHWAEGWLHMACLGGSWRGGTVKTWGASLVGSDPEQVGLGGHSPTREQRAGQVPAGPFLGASVHWDLRFWVMWLLLAVTLGVSDLFTTWVYFQIHCFSFPPLPVNFPHSRSFFCLMGCQRLLVLCSVVKWWGLFQKKSVWEATDMFL